MRLGPLHLFSRLNSAGVCVVALHWKNSITWSWALYWQPATEFVRNGFYRCGRLRHGVFGFNSRLGCIHFNTQRPMWRLSQKRA